MRNQKAHSSILTRSEEEHPLQSVYPLRFLNKLLYPRKNPGASRWSRSTGLGRVMGSCRNCSHVGLRAHRRKKHFSGLPTRNDGPFPGQRGCVHLKDTIDPLLALFPSSQRQLGSSPRSVATGQEVGPHGTQRALTSRLSPRCFLILNFPFVSFFFKWILLCCVYFCKPLNSFFQDITIFKMQ